MTPFDLSIESWALTLLIQVLRYLTFAGFAYLIFYVIRKRKWLYKKIQEKWPKKTAIRTEVTYSLLTLLMASGIKVLINYFYQMGWTQIYTDFAAYGWGYFAFSIVAMIVIHDTWFYWSHRLMHHPKLFKTVHLVHHKSHNPTPWAAFSFHPTEAILEFGFIFPVIFLMPVHPIAILILITWMLVFNVIGHLGFELYPKKFIDGPLGKIFNSSTHHNMHHKYFKGNYGLYFNVWDRIMGTNHPDYEEKFAEVAGRKEPELNKEESGLEPSAPSFN